MTTKIVKKYINILYNNSNSLSIIEDENSQHDILIIKKSPIVFFIEFISLYYKINIDIFNSIIGGCWIVLPDRFIYDTFYKMIETRNIEGTIQTGIFKSSHGLNKLGIFNKDNASDHINIEGKLGNMDWFFGNDKCPNDVVVQIIIGYQPKISSGSNENPINNGYTWFQLEGNPTKSIGHMIDYLIYITDSKRGNIGPCRKRCNLTEKMFYSLKKDYPLLLELIKK
tara:strand:+ start:61 stop:738 length:678 start_codon:yes stop_codon:yes gene_type:complete